MAKYHIYGIGNALVDMEYEVAIEDLGILGIDKGVMTLVDEQQQASIMNHLKDHHHQRGSGGSAANSIIAFSQFGGKGYYSCRVADDELGHFYMQDLVDGGVDTNHHTEKDPGVSSPLRMRCGTPSRPNALATRQPFSPGSSRSGGWLRLCAPAPLPCDE